MSLDRFPAARIPSATFRAQFNYLFTLRDGVTLVPYLHEVGITDLYASPIFHASPKSLHGYDVVNPLEINPEIGTEEDFRALASALKEKGMGLILDIVPNHMGIDWPENVWWMDILENGPGSVYADFFDINWHPVKKELDNRVLLPVLGDQYGNILDRGELKLVLEGGSFFITYYEHRFPLRPKSYLNVLAHRLDELRALKPAEDDFQEYLSILTALRHLPLYSATDPYSITERNREKEVIKRRLANLRRKSPQIRQLVDDNVTIFNGRPGNPDSFDLLDRLLEQQIYRLAFWRVATEEINYRRFFDINQLAALRVEKRRVFREYHKLIFRWIREGLVSGLRVDHPDGLYHPTRYFRRLQEESFVHLMSGAGAAEADEERLREEFRRLSAESDYRPMYIVGEKILVRDERMPADWPIYGTTGYNFLNTVNGVFVDTANGDRFRTMYAAFSGEHRNFEDIVYDNKKLIMLTMSSEINMLGEYLNRISEKDRHTRDFTLNSLTAALTEIIAVFPVYRTYIYREEIDARDREYVEYAVSWAKRKNAPVNALVYDFLQDVLLLKFPPHLPEHDRQEWLDFVMKFQQLTGPFMAKGMEDTSFYVYNPLVSLNEVGGSPDLFGITIEEFHRANSERLISYPHTMLATSTHDSKRNEDVRARINVLSEIPDVWDQSLRRWSELNTEHRITVGDAVVPSPNEEYLLYQTMIGFSPVGPVDEDVFEVYCQRLKDYMLKAAREAKVTTSWINPKPEYENALLQFIDAIIARVPTNTFLYEFEQFLRTIEPYGLYNSLSQLLLKITCPGVPDFYQGTMIWNFRLVDPDNRYPIDYDLRARMLTQLLADIREKEVGELSSELAADLRNGRIKLYVTLRALNFRRENRDLYDTGEYIPVEGVGERGENVCAFGRCSGSKVAITVTPRFLTRVIDDPEALFRGDDRWLQSFLVLRFAEPGTVFRNIFTGETLKTQGHRMGSALFISDVLRSFPVALLEKV